MQPHFLHILPESFSSYTSLSPPFLFNLLQVLLLMSSLSSPLTMKDKSAPGYLDGLRAEVSETS